MSNTEILNNNIIDLKVGIDLAEITNNGDLKKYAYDRIKYIISDSNINQSVYFEVLVDSYVIDLVLFLQSSNILRDKESKDYFKGRLFDLIDKFPYLRDREDISRFI